MMETDPMDQVVRDQILVGDYVQLVEDYGCVNRRNGEIGRVFERLEYPDAQPKNKALLRVLWVNPRSGENVSDLVYARRFKFWAPGSADEAQSNALKAEEYNLLVEAGAQI